MPDDYEVGYAKPPQDTRFQPGQSGNPAGRPKGPQTLARDLIEELQEEVTFGDGEAQETLSKQRSILRALTAKAIEGDARATAMVLDLVQRLIGAGPGLEPDRDDNPAGSARERLAARIAEIHRRLAAAGAIEGDDDPAPDEPAAEPGRGA